MGGKHAARHQLDQPASIFSSSSCRCVQRTHLRTAYATVGWRHVNPRIARPSEAPSIVPDTGGHRDAAAEILDERGIDGLTMRAVAERLDAGAMSLYRHVDGREELLDLVIVHLTSDIARPAGERGLARRPGTPRARHAGRIAAAPEPHRPHDLSRRGGRRRPADAGPGAGHPARAGLSPADAAFANHALGNYVAGAALWEAVGLGGATGGARAQQGAGGGGRGRTGPGRTSTRTWPGPPERCSPAQPMTGSSSGWRRCWTGSPAAPVRPDRVSRSPSRPGPRRRPGS